MPTAYFITHPDVVVDPQVPISRWPLSEAGRARMRCVLALPWAASLTRVASSGEQKAIDGAEILSRELGIPHQIIPELGENDRSATGFLPPQEFWSVVEEFFAHPEMSVRGWETAAQAQERIVQAVLSVRELSQDSGPVAFVSHGGVGCLLHCHLASVPISRELEQPSPPAGSRPGTGGGYYLAFDLGSESLLSSWQPIDPA
jgi:broad specificity phosphatase PhoE